MTPIEASKLEIGDKVKHEDGTPGSIVEKGYRGIKILWEDGVYGTLYFSGMSDGDAERLNEVEVVNQ